MHRRTEISTPKLRRKRTSIESFGHAEEYCAQNCCPMCMHSCIHISTYCQTNSCTRCFLLDIIFPSLISSMLTICTRRFLHFCGLYTGHGSKRFVFMFYALSTRIQKPFRSIKCNIQKHHSDAHEKPHQLFSN